MQQNYQLEVGVYNTLCLTVGKVLFANQIIFLPFLLMLDASYVVKPLYQYSLMIMKTSWIYL